MAVHLNQQDLTFILRQIKIAEAHASGVKLTELRVDAATGELLTDRALYDTGGNWSGLPDAPRAVPDPHTPYGLRTVDGTYNNIVPGRETWGASGQPMPHLLDPSFASSGYPIAGSVTDADPRTISNLVVDASLDNPAAIAAALRLAGSADILGDLALVTNAYEAVRSAPATTSAEALAVLETNLASVLADKGITLTNGSIDVLNVTPDEGLSKPFNAWMTFFGQFFDHGLDLISKGGNGTVFIPLAADDPLVTHGPDGIQGNGDEVRPEAQFMVLTRSTPVDGSQRNVTTPFVDQNQTYTSNPSHQVFLREYEMVDGRPVSTGRLLGGENGGLATWHDVKEQARTMLGIDLRDSDVSSVPQLLTDPYGAFIPGANGLPQVMVRTSEGDIAYVSGSIAAPLALSATQLTAGATIANADGTPTTLSANETFAIARTFNAFLDDIAHNAVPVLANGILVPDSGDAVGNDVAVLNGRNTEYDNDLLDRHFATGDGRGNENIGLTAVHHIFHSEHNRQVDAHKLTILTDGDLAFVRQWLDAPITQADLNAIKAGLATAPNRDAFVTALADGDASTGLIGIELNWNGERLFQAGRFATEMQYQHLVFEEFARKVQPLIDPFVFNSVTEIDPAIFAEFANTVYRFGHSMLTENMPRVGADGQALDGDLGLIDAFLNPVMFDSPGDLAADGTPTLNHDAAAGAIIRGMIVERGSEIDEFVVGAVRNNLLGLPLDLAAINIARGRETGTPTLNEARTQLFAATGSTFLTPYTSWADMTGNLKNPMSIVNFVAAYGTHSSIAGATTLDGKRDAAMALVLGGSGAPGDRLDYLNSRGTWAGIETGLNAVDLWIGGLAEKQMPFGGLLGSTFNAVFEAQMENLQDADRFYYLTRVQGQNFLVELEQNSFSKLMMANTDLALPGPDGVRGTGDDIVPRHIGVDAFADYDYELEVDIRNQVDQNGVDNPLDPTTVGKDPTGNDPVLEAMGLGKVMRDDPQTDVDENAISGLQASVNALVRHYNADGTPSDRLIDGAEDGNGNAASPVTWSDVKANALKLGIVLTDADLGNAPVLRVDADGSFGFAPSVDVTRPVVLANGSFDDRVLIAGTAGVFSDPSGNYTVASPAGWTITGGHGGGTFAPFARTVDAEGRDGTNVAYLMSGATMAQAVGTTLVAGTRYTYTFQVGDRFDFTWPGGVARLMVGNAVVSSVDLLPPANGQWRDFTLDSGVIPTNLAGQQMRLVVQSTGPANTQMLVDDVDIIRTSETVYRSDLTPANTPDYHAASDPFARDADGNVLRTGQALATPGPVIDATLIDTAALARVFDSGHYLRFTGGEHVLAGGTDGNDTIITDFGDDGIWGDAGDDRIESGAGVDLVNGGDGDDIITDSGDTGDFLKGEGGNDVIANSNGIDILMGGTGKDVVFVGVDSTEVFAGAGDDFVLGGDGADLLMGNEGDDWMEAGGGFDTTAGDNSELFFNSVIKGHDVMFAGGDEHDFDGESGDDIMVQGESVMRSEGMFGFDWAIFKGNALNGYADMRIPIFTTEEADILRNRFDSTEALSGWKNDDTLIGDDRTAADAADPGGGTVAANEGVFFNDGLDAAGLARIAGLNQIVTLGANGLFEAGNILLGGGGSDRLQGNAADDILDGDRWLNVRISIRGGANGDGAEIATVDSLKHAFQKPEGWEAGDPLGFPAEWEGKSLFELMIARTVRPDQMHIVREVLDVGSTPGEVDTAVFSDVRANYTVTNLGDGTFRVSHTGFVQGPATRLSDGVDTLHNIERAQFADRAVFLTNVAATGAPTVNDTTPTELSQLQASAIGIADLNGLPATFGYQWQSLGADGVTWTDIVGATGQNFTPQQAQVGRPVRVAVSFTDEGGYAERVFSAPTDIVGDTITDGAQGTTITGTNGADRILANGGNDTVNALAGDDFVQGGAGNDTLNAGAGNDEVEGGAGTDVINGGTGDDLITWNGGVFLNPNDGRDIVDGGIDGTDEFVVNGAVLAAETFRVYTRAAWDAVAGNDLASLNGLTEIVITRGGTGNANIIAELRDIEEIRIGTRTVSGTNPPAGGPAGLGDTVIVSGDFSTTSLNLNTITIEGTAGNDAVDVSGLSSAHRIVFRSNGGVDTIVGTLREQDVIELAPGTTRSDYVETHANGMTTLTHGSHTITYASAGTPSFAETLDPGEEQPGGGVGMDGAFALTVADLAGIKNLVQGRPAFEGDDDTDGATGVRSLSGAGNNPAHPEFGAADQPFIRLTDAHYGAFDPAIGNNALNPLYAGLDARAISNVLGTQEAGLPHQANGSNIFFMAFGQYFDHGLDFLPKSAANGIVQIDQLGTGRTSTTNNPADLTRGEVSSIVDGVPQHLNKTSPYVDQNQAYGSHELVGQFLRESDGNQGVGARLLAGAADPTALGFNLLPTLRELIQHHWEADTVFHDASLPGGSMSFRAYFSNFPITETRSGSLFNAAGAFDPEAVSAFASNFMGSGNALLLDTNPFVSLLDHYVAGDGRTNENVALTAMHTIWARNHNFHAENLVEAGFEGTPEEVFQAAKMLNESEYQRVVFDEFADQLIGGMRGLGTHGHDGYNPDVDARISHEFASAVYRVGHSLIGETLTVMGPDGQPRQVALFDAFLNPSNDASVFTAPLPPGYVPQPGYAQLGANAILAGVATQPAEEVDFNIVDAVRNDLVRISADLFAFNVARGRDVGLGSLNQVRADLMASADPYIHEAVGYAGDLRPYASWEDFQARNGLSATVIAQFKQAYPDLVLATPAERAAFVAANPDIAIHQRTDGTEYVSGIDRVDLWVGGLAEQHINGGVVGQTFWVVLHEQFDRLQEGDRLYYTDRFDNFDFYENIVDGQNFSDIVARNTGLTGLQEDIFAVDDEDGDNGDGGTVGDGDGDDDGDIDTDPDDDGDEDSDTDPDDDTENDDDGDTTGGGTDNPPTEPSSNQLVGTANGDVLSGTALADTVLGLEGDDNILSGEGADVIRAGDGNDFIEAGGGRDVVFGGAGGDDILAGAGADMVYGDAGADRILAGAGNDLVTAGAGNDIVIGGDGDDLIMSELGDGDDSYWGDDMGGGTGIDTLDMSAITANITANLGTGLAGRGGVSSGQSGNDTLWGIENFVGGSGNDDVTASDAVNVMDGGLGADTYRFQTAAAAHGDTIASFQPGDRIDLSGIDANQGVAGNQSFTLATGAAFTGVGQLLVTQEARADGDYTVVAGNTGGDASPEFKFSIKGAPAATAADFAL
ncbi:hypothetical protein ASG40_19815 [Methylobacterium sp. Leaf399]|uniref:peroxidase family protein n=1 Tax=Methylobacterium sp. Leaf399 TaxID=1736364 RepID=UPI0006F519D0|nr:peroxidase family protein [Methylobacterium sp. Leaf399]KQT13242.1 hypothetical protein ASG40_19815 [Methylobacterium sp. Leaf399]